MNPYASPSECSQPTYDRTLLKRCLWFGLWFGLAMLFINAGLIWQNFDAMWNPQHSIWDTLYSFFVDWSYKQ